MFSCSKTRTVLTFVRLMFWWLKLVLHFHIFMTWLPDIGNTPGTCCWWKAQSITSKTSPALTTPSASFVSSSPSRLFVILPQPLVSSSVGQSVCSEVFISTAGLPGCRGNKRLFKILRSSPSSHVHPSHPNLLLSQNFSSSSHCTQLPVPYSSPSTCLLFWSFYHLSFLRSPCCCRPSSPFSCSSAGYLGIGGIVLSRTLCCSDLVRDQSGVQVCVYHLVATVPSSRGSQTSTQLEIWEALEQLSESERHTERHGADCIAHTGSTTTTHTLILSWSWGPSIVYCIVLVYRGFALAS